MNTWVIKHLRGGQERVCPMDPCEGTGLGAGEVDRKEAHSWSEDGSLLGDRITGEAKATPWETSV